MSIIKFIWHFSYMVFIITVVIVVKYTLVLYLALI